MNYLYHISIICEIYIILSLSANLLAGYSGLLSLTQAGIYGIGGYVSAILLSKYGVSFPVSLIGAIGFNLIASIPILWFSIRLWDMFFCLATLAWQIIVFSIMYNWVSLTNGPYGITGVPKPSFLSIQFSMVSEYALFTGIVLILVLLFFVIFHRTPLSRYLKGVRDDHLAMISLGKRTSYYKVIAILLSVGFSSLAGALFASYFSYIDPTSFTVDESILIISIVLIGGLGSIRGSIAGALFYVLLPEILRLLQIPDLYSANLRMIIYAIILIIVVLFRPYGFFGKYRFE